MNKIEYAQFLAEKNKHDREHQQLMRDGKYDNFDWEPFLDRQGIQGEERKQFLASRNQTQKELAEVLREIEGRS